MFTDQVTDYIYIQMSFSNQTENDDSIKPYSSTWAPSIYYRPEKETYNFAGYEICIYESLDSYGAMIWPGAVALCKYLEMPAAKQQVDLLDKSAIEIGAGTGLLSVVATLLGAKVVATDLPDILGNLKCNLSRNTRWRCRHPPQVAALSWGYDLDNTFPRSTHHYDYVLAADVVYHHIFLDELLVTMKHLVQSGTTLIWSNKIRYESDLRFVENFKEAFHTTLLAEKDEIRIYKATAREVQEASGQTLQIEEHLQKGNQTAKGDKNVCPVEDVIMGTETGRLHEDAEDSRQERVAEKIYEVKDILESRERTENVKIKTDTSDSCEQHLEYKDEAHQLDTDQLDSQKMKPRINVFHIGGDCLIVNMVGSEEYFQPKASNEENDDLEECCSDDDDDDDDDEGKGDDDDEGTSSGKEDNSYGTAQRHEEKETLQTSEGDDTKTTYQSAWTPSLLYRPEKEIYNFAGYEICIYESLDSYGSMIWPGAVALCKYLETPAAKQQVDLLDKSAIEIGAGTGLLSVVATLLGAKVVATDLPDILGNLKCNLSRNTRWRCRHPPQVAALSWGHDLDNTFPRSTHRYDYVLAADVVYHHSFLDELLVTMKHLVQSGTTLIWSNKIRYQSDLRFVENFKEAFHTILLAEKDEIRIYKATAWEVQEASGQTLQIEEHLQEGNQTAKGDKNVCPVEDVIMGAETGRLHEDAEDSKQERVAEKIYEVKDILESRERTETVKIKTGVSGSHVKTPVNKDEMHQLDTDELDSQISNEVYNTGNFALNELLATMKHLVQSGTTLIWSNEIRDKCDFRFVESFKEAFHTTLLAEKGDLRIYKATAREGYSGQMMQTNKHMQERNQTAKGEKNVCPFEDGITGNKTETLEDFKDSNQEGNAEEKSEDNQTAKGEENVCPIEDVITQNNTDTSDEDFPGSKREGNAEKTSENNQTAKGEANMCPIKDGITQNKTETLDEHLEGSEQENNADEKSVGKQTARRGKDVCPIEGVTAVNKMEICVEEKRMRCLNKDLDGGGQEKTAQEKSEDNNRKENTTHEERGVEDNLENGYENYVCKINESTLASSYSGMPEITGLNVNAMSHQENVEELTHESPVYSDSEQETHHFVGCDITVQYLHSWHGRQCGPATLALCKFLENNRHQVNLKGKSVLELGAGTGIVSIVASLLGAWVTATDAPEVLEILTENFNANTRGRSKYSPQTEVLQWGQNLARSFPPSIYHYDYILAADVVYSHSYLKELLATMCHFCQRGTTLIWAHEFQRHSDLAFEAQFESTLYTKLLTETGDVKIYMGMGKGKGTPPCWTI
ncbi:hypothetical protein ACEWY4_016238 [Coilia grayii]|uniref:Uncharacterized protein n=1 Tax=Coilia grayii TaxID=363190 RepID=A0ABD1JJV1_9TELE